MSEVAASPKHDPLKNYISCTLHEAYDLVQDCFRAKRVPNLISSPGVGKSSLIHQIAEAWEYLVIDVRLSTMDPTELNGFPYIWDSPDGRKIASYVPMDIFPVVGKELPINPKTGRQYKGWVLFLDEFNAGSMLVQAAAYKVVLDRMIGMYKLDDRCVMATAGNLMDDKAIVNRLSTATQSRVIHLPIRVCNDTWHFWADAHDVDYRVTSYLRRFPTKLHDFDPNHTDLTFPCPRTWEFVSDLMRPYDPIPIEKLPLLAGTIGKGEARSFHAFSRVFKNLPSIEEIIHNPIGVNFSDEPSVQFALTGMIGHYMDKTNIRPLLQFAGRLGADHQVVAIRQAVGRDYDLLASNEILEWSKKNTNELIRRR